MIDLNSVQKDLVAIKKSKGFNTTETWKEIICITEELGELAAAFRDYNSNEIEDAIGDMLLYLLGLCEIRKINSEELIQRLVAAFRARTHRSHV